MTGLNFNQLVLSVVLLERGVRRYTPADVPALDLVLKHESQLIEAGHPRKVSLEMRAVGFGEIVRSLDALALGSAFTATGFLASQRNGRGVVLHLTNLTDVQAPPPATPDDAT